MKNNLLMMYGGYAALFVIMITGSLFAWSSQSTIASRIAEAEEEQRPAEIELTLVTPIECSSCNDGTNLTDYIETQDVFITSSEIFTSDSEEGMSLIERYQITRLPAILVDGEYSKDSISDLFESLGGVEVGDLLVIEQSQPVYFDLLTQAPIGLVTATFLSDSSCGNCYDPQIHRSVLENNFGVTIIAEKSVDSSSYDGQQLISTYNITEIPTVVLSPDAVAYTALVNAWGQVGTVEEDGVLVFRRNAALGGVTYNDLETGEFISPDESN